MFFQRSLQLIVLLTGITVLNACQTGTQPGADQTGQPADSAAAVSGEPSRTVAGSALTGTDQELVDRMRNASNEEVKVYLKEVLALPLPPDHVLPDDVKNAGSPQKASDALKAHYPQFQDKKGQALLDAIKADPIAHRQLILDSRAVRAMYAAEQAQGAR